MRRKSVSLPSEMLIDFIGAEFPGKGERLGGDVDHRDACAAQLRGKHGQKADRPGAKQRHTLALTIAGARDRMQADRQRLGQRGRRERQISGTMTHCAGIASKKVAKPPCMCGVLEAEPMK